MIAICDYDRAIGLVPNKTQWRESLTSQNPFAVFFNMGIADAQQRQAGSPEDILGFEFGHGRLLQLLADSGYSLGIVDQAQIKTPPQRNHAPQVSPAI